MNTIEFENGSWIECLTQVAVSQRDVIDSDYANIWSSFTIGTNTYNVAGRNLKIVYEGDMKMRVLFVRPEKYDEVCAWYDGLDTVQKHRKVLVICKSPAEFREKFDVNKMGSQWTMFYFDDKLGLSKSYEYCREFAKLYNEDDARYICESKMRQIDVADLMYRNTFDWFKGFSVAPECLDELIRNSKKSFVCRSLL